MLTTETAAAYDVSPPAGQGASVVSDRWPELVRHVRKESPRIGSMLEHGCLVGFDLPRLEVGFAAGSFHLEQMKDAETLQVFQSLAEGFYRQPVKPAILAVDGRSSDGVPPSLAEERRSRETGRKQQLEQEARSHPAVRAAREVLGGEIIEITPIDKEDSREP